MKKLPKHKKVTCFWLKVPKRTFGVTFDPKTLIFGVFADFGGNSPFSLFRCNPIKIGSKIITTMIWEKSESFVIFQALVKEL